jgi:hypothetical protein
LPITSTTKHRVEATADCLILSTSLHDAFSAVSAPMVSSVPGRSLLIDGRQAHDRDVERRVLAAAVCSAWAAS